MTHPLTDKDLEQFGIPDDLRDHVTKIYFDKDMRSAADWQLEKCDDELGNILHCLALAGKITEEERIQIYALYKETMRPG